jgi:hypothetical protein
MCQEEIEATINLESVGRYFKRLYSSLASIRIGKSASASFHKAKNFS